MDDEYNAIKGYFYQGKDSKKPKQKEYVFTLPEKYQDNLDISKVSIAIVEGKKEKTNKTLPVPFVVTEWLHLPINDLQQHKPILRLKFNQ